jgi:hypothetical protein
MRRSATTVHGTRGIRAARRRAAGVAALVLAAVAAGACRGGATEPEPVFKGSYRLLEIGGTPLPFPLPPQCPPLGDCRFPQSGRVEVMSRGRIRDIMEYAEGPPPWRTVWDTVISAYRLEARRVIVQRTPFGNSFFGPHSDTGEVDTQGRFLITPQSVGMKLNYSLYFYAPADPRP